MTQGFDSGSILRAVKLVLPAEKERIALHEPVFNGSEWTYVRECIDTGWVSSVGSFVDRFEKEIAEYTGAEHAVVTVNGTAALHMCLLLAGVSTGDEVLVPALSFVATANAVSYCGAIPHFVDSEERSLGLDPSKLADYLSDVAELRSESCWNKKTGRPITAAVPMHTFGHPVDLQPLVEVCSRYRIAVIEDAAESLGSFYKGKHTGNFGLLSALSFNGNKIVTTGGGGAILTQSSELARRAKHITTTAKVSHQWDFFHDRVGFNYRMPNLNAALGCAQLEQLEQFIINKRSLAERYRKALESCAVADFFSEPKYAKSNYWLNVILLKPELSNYKEEVLRLLNNNGIMARPAWKLLNQLPMFRDSPCMDLSVAESLEKRIINIPSSAIL